MPRVSLASGRGEPAKGPETQPRGGVDPTDTTGSGCAAPASGLFLTQPPNLAKVQAYNGETHHQALVPSIAPNLAEKEAREPSSPDSLLVSTRTGHHRSQPGTKCQVSMETEARRPNMNGLFLEKSPSCPGRTPA